MRIPQPFTNLLPTLVLFPALATAIDIDCKQKIKVNDVLFNLLPLSGPHSVSWARPSPPSIQNTTYTIDICQRLVQDKNVPKADKCPNGTHVCGITEVINPGDNTSTIEEVIPIAGQYTFSGGNLDPHWTRLKTSSSHADSQSEGLRLELHGGRYGKRKQKAVIELVCLNNTEKELTTREAEDEEDSGDDETLGEVDDGAGGILHFISYGVSNDDEDVLRLTWNTPHACEDTKDEAGDGTKKGAHWGFFTWFIIVAFLSTATYLIFGSWLNYNRYGARGWDLLPHGDTIRDIPYIFRDWMRRVIDTVQGSGSRGGYSAV